MKANHTEESSPQMKTMTATRSHVIQSLQYPMGRKDHYNSEIPTNPTRSGSPMGDIVP